jgi:uncharacterized membrane protein YfcA
MSIELFIGLALLAFLFEYVSILLGMGYGIVMTPLLLLAGFHPLQIIPAVLLSEFACGIVAAIFHQRLKNVDFRFGTRAFKTVTILFACSIIGAVVAVLLAVTMVERSLELCIGATIVLIGVSTLAMRGRSIRFSWKAIAAFGLLGAFTKAMSGGGFGPLVTGGQIVSGVPSREAIGISSLAKAATCGIGIIMYVVWADAVDMSLAPPLLIGALFSVPLATMFVKKVGQERLKVLIGIVTIVLGAVTLLKLLV